MIARWHLFFAFTVCCTGIASAADIQFDTAKIEEAAAAKGALNKDEGVFKIASSIAFQNFSYVNSRPSESRS